MKKYDKDLNIKIHVTFRKYLDEIFILEIFALWVKSHEAYEFFLLSWSLNLKEYSKELNVTAMYAEDTICVEKSCTCSFKALEQTMYTFTFIYLFIHSFS